jgi:hypothetical protein
MIAIICAVCVCVCVFCFIIIKLNRFISIGNGLSEEMV